MSVMRGVLGTVVFVMLMGILAIQPAKAGDVQWNLQLHWQMPVHKHYLGCIHYPHPPCHNCSGGTIGTGPTTTHTDRHNIQFPNLFLESRIPFRHPSARYLFYSLLFSQ